MFLCEYEGHRKVANRIKVCWVIGIIGNLTKSQNDAYALKWELYLDLVDGAREFLISCLAFSSRVLMACCCEVGGRSPGLVLGIDRCLVLQHGRYPSGNETMHQLLRCICRKYV